MKVERVELYQTCLPPSWTAKIISSGKWIHAKKDETIDHFRDRIMLDVLDCGCMFVFIGG